MSNLGLPWWLSGEESTCNARDPGSIPGSERFPWSRKWQPTPIFLPGESHEQRRLAGYSPQGCKELDMTEQLSTHTHTERHNLKIDPGGWNHCSISFSLCTTEVSYQIKWQKEKGRAESESYFDGVTSRGRFGTFQLQDFLFEFFK